jgi:EpsI family protein
VSQPARRYLAPFMVLAFGAAAGLSLRNSRPTAPPGAIDLTRLPLAVGDFEGRELPPDDSVFAYLGADEMIDRVYVDEEAQQAVKLSVVFARGWRALHSPRDCFKNQGWSVIEDRPLQTAASGGLAQPIYGNLLIMSKQGQRMATVYTFTTAGATTGDWLRHSFRMAVGQGTHGGALVVAVAGSSGPEQDDAAAKAATTLVEAIHESLRQLMHAEGKAGSAVES